MIKTGKPNSRIAFISSDHGADLFMYVAVGLWALFIFCGWTVAQMIFAETAPVRIAGIDEAAFSTISSWLPLASDIARGNLFPAAPSLGDGLSELRFYPYITLWLHGLTIAVFGLAGSATIGEVLWPTAGFLLLVGLFRRFLPRRWAVTLAALGFLAFLDFPLRAFLYAIITGTGWSEAGINALPDVASFPVPALTVTLFLASLLLSLQRKRLHAGRLALLTVIWALQSQVHLVNATIGILFWFSHFPLELARQNKTRSRAWLLGQVAAQAMLALAVLAPAIAGWAEVATGDLDFLGSKNIDPSLFGAYYYFAYFLFPLALTTVLFVVIRLDYYELLTRFRPIYALMLVELLLVTFHLATGRGIPSENIFSRLGLYVLHPLYYVPVIHFLARLEIGGPAESFSQGAESAPWARTLRTSLKWLSMDASIVYLPIFFVVLTAYAGSSAIASYRYAEITGFKSDARTAATVASLTNGAKAGDGLAAALPSANLLVPIVGRFQSLWINRFANEIKQDEIISRLALYAQLTGWSADNFQRFMAPIPLRGIGSVNLDGAVAPQGVGYWLAFHRAGIDGASALSAHRKAMLQAFDAVNINADACRFGLTRWLAVQPPPVELMVRETRDTAQGRLYILNWEGTTASRTQCPKGR